MKYVSLFDGIGAAHAAWMPLGWRCLWTAEIEKFPVAVVEARCPGIPNLGDVTQITQEMIDAHERPDLVVGGSPCQSFSVAGLRAGLDDARGNLALRFMQLVGLLAPQWVVWENVPGVLSSGGGRDFGSILGALAELGYGWAYRVLDAQHYGVAQRRRRVFVVGHLGDWRRAAAVLSLAEGMRGDPAPSRPSRQGPAADAGQGAACASHDPAVCLTARESKGPLPEADLSTVVAEAFVKAKRAQTSSDDESWKQGEVSPTINHFDVGDTRATAVVAYTLHEPSCTRAEAFSVREDAKAGNFSATPAEVGLAVQSLRPSVQSHHAQIFIAEQTVAHTSDGVVADPITAAEGKTWTNEGTTFRLRNCVQQAVGTDVYNGAITGEVAATMGTPGSSVNASGPTVMEAMAFKPSHYTRGKDGAPTDVVSPLSADADKGDQDTVIHHAMAVRRLTPLECERLQGFPDGWTAIEYRKKPAADGPRYRALGNSMAVPVMRWIGERIAKVQRI